MASLVKAELEATIDDLRHSETLLPRPRKRPAVPRFAKYNFKSHGDTILLVIPTDNEDKVNTLKAWFEERKPLGANIHAIKIKASTGVGEQPYDEAGLQGAYNRITNALDQLSSEPGKFIDLEKEAVGTVIVASIENFIQKSNIDRATDYGLIIVHNVTTGKTDATLSQGVTVPVPYVTHAQTLGYGDKDERHGMKTAGAVLAANVEGLDEADWHKVVVGVPRYHILKEAMLMLGNPMVV